MYAMAARELVKLDLDRRETELASVAAPLGTMPAVIKSKWLGR